MKKTKSYNLLFKGGKVKLKVVIDLETYESVFREEQQHLAILTQQGSNGASL